MDSQRAASSSTDLPSYPMARPSALTIETTVCSVVLLTVQENIPTLVVLASLTFFKAHYCYCLSTQTLVLVFLPLSAFGMRVYAMHKEQLEQFFQKIDVSRFLLLD